MSKKNGSKKEVLSRIAQANAALAKLKTVWNDQKVKLQYKVRLLRALVLAIFLYACESWTLNADLERRINAMEMRCYRRLLGISYREHRPNAEVRNIITDAIGQHKDLLQIVKERKLKWYGHVTRGTGLAKTILQGTVEGGRRQGRQRRRWQDDVKDWTELDFAETQRLAHDRESWRVVVSNVISAPTTNQVKG